MNSNSYQIKQFAVLIVTALLGVYATNKNTIFVFIGIFPTITCWFLDSYYLLMERKFRGLYNDVIGVTHIQFVPPYGMDVKSYTCQIDPQYCYFKILISPTILFYLVLVIALGMIGRLL
jgi:hypothetical protein